MTQLLDSMVAFYVCWGDLVIMLSVMMILLLGLVFFIKKWGFSLINRFIATTNKKYLQIYNRHHINRYLLHSIVCLYLLFWEKLLRTSGIFTPLTDKITDICLTIYMTFAVTMLVMSIINIIADIYRTKAIHNSAPITLHTQILKIITISCAIFIGLSCIIDISLSTFFTSLGAAAALLTFIFKDTILGLLASLQLTLLDIIRIGDWITIDQYNVNGTIESIAITVVKIRNFDRTISTIPTYSLLTANIKNWRGMIDAGGRRIQRVMYIDIDSIIFCTETLIEDLKKLHYVITALDKRANFIDNITNMEIFRLYIKEYLKQNKYIHQQDFFFLVRELDSTPQGLPLEIYVFSNVTEWSKYEDIQSDIFDHLFAILPKFGLRVYQNRFGLSKTLDSCVHSSTN